MNTKSDIGSLPDEQLISGFQTRIRHDNVLVRDYQVHGVRTLPTAALLDLLFRAGVRNGNAGARTELRQLLLPAQVVTADGVERRLLFRPVAGTEGTAVAVAATPPLRSDGNGSREDAIATCLVCRSSDPVPGGDIAALQREMAAVEPTSLACLYDWAGRLGMKYGDFLRAEGKVAQAPDGRRLAELKPSAVARSRKQEFVVHPALLEAAVLIALADMDAAGQPDSPVQPIAANRLRLGTAAGSAAEHSDTVYIDVYSRTWLDAETIETSLRILDSKGQPLVDIEGLRASRPAQDAQRVDLRVPPRPR